MFRIINRKKVVIALFTLGIFGCDYLDFDESNRLYDEEAVYSIYGNTSSMLNHVYSYLQQDLGVMGGGAMRDCATDDAEFSNPTNGVQDINNGAWSALNVKDDVWGSMYQGIRAANDFLLYFSDTAFEDFRFSSSYPKWKDAFQYFEYEARGLRAYMYFELAKRYGDVPLTTEKLTIEDANTVVKTPFNEVIDFIVDECDAVCDHLPVSYLATDNAETGKITKGFVMALKARALLYAASPLHNPSGNVEKWESAASASLAFIDSARIKGWYVKESGANAVNNFNSSEFIAFKNNSNNNSFEAYNFPVRFTFNQSSRAGTCPTQNLVDAFETRNGYRVTLTETGWQCEDPEFDASNPYANRDLRFYQTILYDGAPFKGSVIETFVGGLDYGTVTSGGSATGYYLKKYVEEDVDFSPDNVTTKPHYWIIFRYGEVLLNYAEAMMGAFNDADYSDGTYTMSAREALNEVRAAVPMPLITETDPVEFIDILKRERRVELAFEDHRFWDVRRWKDNSSQKNIYGVKIMNTQQGIKVYSKYKYETRYWNDKMNLYPISQQELYINSNLSPQNPGW